MNCFHSLGVNKKQEVKHEIIVQTTLSAKVILG